MGIESRLSIRESIYWVNINVNAENISKSCIACLEFHATQLNDKPTPHDIPCKAWKLLSAEIFMLSNQTYICIIVHHSKLPVVKMTDGLSAVSLINMGKIIVAKYVLLRKIMSDAGTHFASERFQASEFSSNCVIKM